MVQNDPLAVLFGGVASVKLLRFFLFNPQSAFSFDDITRRARLVRRTARTELNTLERAGVIHRKHLYEQVSGSSHKRRVLGYVLDAGFPLLVPLQSFFFATAPINSQTMLKYIKRIGSFDVIIAAGVFMGEFDRRMDVLLVAKKVPEKKVEQAIRALEAELGIEIKFAFLKTDEFKYRLNMRDKLVRDVSDYPHQILVDKLGVRDEMMRK